MENIAGAGFSKSDIMECQDILMTLSIIVLGGQRQQVIVNLTEKDVKYSNKGYWYASLAPEKVIRLSSRELKFPNYLGKLLDHWFK